MKVSFKRNKFLIWIFIVVLLVVLLNVFQKEVRNFFYWFSSPIQKGLWQTGNKTSDFFEGLFGFISLKANIEKLEQDNQGLTAEIIKLREIEKENKSLREALNVGLEKEHNLIFSEIISKDVSEDIILIDKGSRDGIAEGMPVITENNALVGKTIEVYNNYSKIMLIFHKNMSFDIKIIQEEKEIAAVAEGKGNSQIILKLIPQKEQIFKGNIIATSHLGGVFPECLLVGKIKDFKKSDVEPFQIAEIDNFLEISELKYVFIIND